MKTCKYLLLLSVTLWMSSCQDDDPITMTEPEPEPIPTPCELGRYQTADFDEIEVSTVQYGAGETVFGLQTLMMDIYQPVGDSLTDRPVIILAFGGAFITGDRSQMEQFARFYAARGYVAASIDYRIYTGFLPTGDDITATAVKAMHDVKAAIRFLRNDALTENNYGISSENIIVGGLSAGAIASLQAAFLDQEDLANSPQLIQDLVAENGGIEGTSNDLDVSSEVVGVINYSGALLQIDYIDAGEPWVISTHGDIDEVVPFGTGTVNVGIPIDIELNGSGAFHPRLEEVGITNTLYTVAGGGHVDIYTEDEFQMERDDFADLQSTWVAERACE